MSKRTIQAYSQALCSYFAWKKTDLEHPDEENIRDFLLHEERRGCGPSSRSILLNAIKYYYRDVVRSKKEITIYSPKKQHKLPVIFTYDEVKQTLRATTNQKHRLLLSVAYGSGLRISEVLSLRIADMDLAQETIHVKQSKGRKDRITVFPQTVVQEMKNYVCERKGDEYVFPSERGGKLTSSTAQKILANAMQKAGIPKQATFHSLRHSFATHLLENGVDTRYVQELLGHRNIQTTQRYTQVTNPAVRRIKSPL